MHGRVRTIPVPTWVKVAVDAWTAAAGLTEGHVLWPIGRGDRVLGERMTEKVVWQLLQPYAVAAGIGPENGAYYAVIMRTISVKLPDEILTQLDREAHLPVLREVRLSVRMMGILHEMGRHLTGFREIDLRG